MSQRSINRQAIVKVLTSSGGHNLSNREVGRRCGVNERTVQRVRDALRMTSTKRIVTRNGRQVEYNVAKIGKVASDETSAELNELNKMSNLVREAGRIQSEGTKDQERLRKLGQILNDIRLQFPARASEGNGFYDYMMDHAGIPKSSAIRAISSYQERDDVGYSSYERHAGIYVIRQCRYEPAPDGYQSLKSSREDAVHRFLTQGRHFDLYKVGYSTNVSARLKTYVQQGWKADEIRWMPWDEATCLAAEDFLIQAFERIAKKYRGNEWFRIDALIDDAGTVNPKYLLGHDLWELIGEWHNENDQFLRLKQINHDLQIGVPWIDDVAWSVHGTHVISSNIIVTHDPARTPEHA